MDPSRLLYTGAGVTAETYKSNLSPTEEVSFELLPILCHILILSYVVCSHRTSDKRSTSQCIVIIFFSHNAVQKKKMKHIEIH